MKKPTDGFCTHIFFASEIIIIFGGLFLHRLSRILKVWVAKTDFERQKWITKRWNPNSIKLSWKAKKRPPKVHTKNRPFVLCTISKDGICHILSSRVESSEKHYLTMMGPRSYLITLQMLTYFQRKTYY